MGFTTLQAGARIHTDPISAHEQMDACKHAVSCSLDTTAPFVLLPHPLFLLRSQSPSLLCLGLCVCVCVCIWGGSGRERKGWRGGAVIDSRQRGKTGRRERH